MNNFAIIIPAFNEKDNLQNLVNRILKILPKANIYIIDDTKTKSEIPNLKKNKHVIHYLRKQKRERVNGNIWNHFSFKNKIIKIL